MVLLPKTLVGRTVLVLLLGLTASHLISVGIYSGDRRAALTSVGGKQVAERIAAATQFVDGLPPGARPDAVRSFWGPAFSVTWTPESTLPAAAGDWRTRLIRSALGFYLDNVPSERVRVKYGQPDDGDPERFFRGRKGYPWMGHMRRMMMDPSEPSSRHTTRMMEDWRGGEILEVSVQLTDGSWLNFSTPALRSSPFWGSQVFLSIVLMTITVLALSVWAIRRATRPLAMIASAADRLGVDMEAPALDEDGPREVRHVARAFNEMQRRLRTFVKDRTQMLAAISHDLRTPITRLRLRAELIEDAEQQKKMLADLEQMEEMISATLAFAQDDAGHEARQPFDLGVLLQGICDDAADAGHSAAYAGPSRFTFNGRLVALRRAFGNLVDNALKYGGSARVALHEDTGHVRITINDDGPGIPADQAERVFAPFYRIEESRNRETGGVGLGLAVVRSIARGHGGDVTLNNRDNGGLTVTVTLPL
ncbi:MAG: HAMP domain-containing protein [Rhodospirillales bacterium]|nr:HAMP domain-containing protein [Rhodospirillales bacterium]